MRHLIVICNLLFCPVLLIPVAAAADQQSWRQRASSSGGDVVRDDIGEEVRFGREVAARMIGRFGLYHNDAITRYITLVGLSLAQNSSRPELAYHFAVLNTSEINAYAAPGGFVFVTKGALEQARDEAELAGVLAHEMTHINGKHVVKELDIRAAEGSAASGLARLIGGSTDAARLAFNQAVDKAMDMLLATGYKREDEVQADTGAVALCALSGYDPSGLVRYFERVGAARGKTTEVLDKTHPAYDARIALIRDVMGGEGIEPAKYRTNKARFAETMKQLK
jgi:predicted Zn-dependent protease